VSEDVLAAGGVVVRGAPGARETLIIHRPRYDDWTHPKGKLDPAESFEDGARREVLEETGWRCELGPELPSVSYTDALGRPKRVRYWMMYPTRDDDFTSGDEVDEIRWMPAAQARRMLSYPRDIETLDAALGLDTPVYLVRHAKAGSRLDWRGDDDQRPISTKGARQAERLREHLALDEVGRIASSPSLRCLQTVQPLAAALSLPVELHDALREEADASTALAFTAGLGGPAVICTHGNIVQELVLTAAQTDPLTGSYGWKKGSTWILERDAGRPVGARYVPPPRDRAD
jgi:8-oxo-dGTP pyrophosphatase MutT (NUDIX family)/phosphohistidine phosphatase SixA